MNIPMKPELQQLLLDIARNAISRKLDKKSPGEGHSADGMALSCHLPPELKEKRATFVTLTIGGRLRGCIGMLEACRPLAEDVAANACAAAFEDALNRSPARSSKKQIFIFLFCRRPRR